MCCVGANPLIRDDLNIVGHVGIIEIVEWVNHNEEEGQRTILQPKISIGEWGQHGVFEVKVKTTCS